MSRDSWARVAGREMAGGSAEKKRKEGYVV